MDGTEGKHKFLSGNEIPVVGLGNRKAGQAAGDDVFNAIVQVDTASEYGVEEEVGHGMRAAMDAGINRNDLFVVSKLWCASMSPDKFRATLDTSLNHL